MHRKVEARRTQIIGTSGAWWLIALALGGSAALGCASTTASGAGPVTVTEETETPTSDRKDGGHFTNDDWWPNRLDLRVLKENAPKGDPVEGDFDYAAEFKKLNLAAVKQDIVKVLTTSQE